MLQEPTASSSSRIPFSKSSDSGVNPTIVQDDSILQKMKDTLGLKTTDECLEIFKAINRDWKSLDYVTPPNRFKRLGELFSFDTRELLLQMNLVMAEYSDRFIEPIPLNLPPEAGRQHYSWLMRVVEGIRKPSYQDSSVDTLAKDRAVITGQMLYLGSRLATLSRPFPRSLMPKLLPAQKQLLFKSIKKGLKLSGLELHSEARSVKLFTEENFKKMLDILQEIVRNNKNVDLVFGAAWFYAPEMKKVSPHLLYMRNEVLSRGGVVFYCGSGGVEDALANSRSRRRAYLDGDYSPARYGLVIT